MLQCVVTLVLRYLNVTSVTLSLVPYYNTNDMNMNIIRRVTSI